MNPVVIGVVLVVLLLALNVAATGEEEERAGAPETERHSMRPRWRELVAVISFLVLLPVGLVYTSGGAIFMAGGPLWWWLWLAGAVVYGVAALIRMGSD